MAMMVYGTAAAQSSAPVADATETTTVDYSFKVNNNALSRFLKLNSDQADKMGGNNGYGRLTSHSTKQQQEHSESGRMLLFCKLYQLRLS